MLILGITHPISWNTAAVLLEDGRIVAAAEEERFVRIKHAPRMIPQNAIEYVLQEGKIRYQDVDIIAISWEGPHKEEDIENSVSRGYLAGSFSLDVERNFWLESLEKEKCLINFLQHRFIRSKIYFVRHHIAHAASTCYVSGFNKSLFLTLDGRGEFESGLIGIYQNGEIEIDKAFNLKESLGNMFANFTSLIGYNGHTDEGKMMGLAPYGKPLESLFDIVKTTDTSIEIDWNKIQFLLHNNITTGGDPTQDERRHFAATAQYLLEKCVLQLVERITKTSNVGNICLAGGVALNIDMNGIILDSGLVKNIFVQPASNDAGCALGAALYIYHQQSGKNTTKMQHSYFGKEWHDEEIKKYVQNSGLKFKELTDVPSEVAKLISENKIIGWMRGRAEFGPRALGARSILGNPTDKRMWKKVNEIKGREYWRPLAPSVIEEASNEFFINHGIESPFMLLKFSVKDEKINKIPAVVHVDKSARPQTVSKETNEPYWNLLKEVDKLVGVPVLINTSFNLRGEPIINSPQDAVRSFFCSNMDYLCIDRYLIHK